MSYGNTFPRVCHVAAAATISVAAAGCAILTPELPRYATLLSYIFFSPHAFDARAPAMLPLRA